MNDDEGKKDEEKLEFTQEGEAVGYIGLDDARILALEHARDNRDFYGGRYARRDLLWEVLSQEESEDYYEIRLSYSPAASFRGEPGMEQFTVEKTGSIRLRRILAQPTQPRSLLLPLSLAGALVIIGAVIAGLFVAGVFNTDTTISVALTPASPARLVSPDLDVTITLEPGSVSEASDLTYQLLSSSDIPVLPPGFSPTSKAFDLSMGAPLLKPISIQVRISAADAIAAGSDGANIALQHYKPGFPR